MRPLWRRNVLLVGDSLGDATMAREIGEPIPIGAPPVPSSPAGCSPASTPLPDADAVAVGVGGAGAMPVAPSAAASSAVSGAGAMPAAAGKHASPAAGHAVVLRVGIINDGDALDALRPKYRPAFDVVLERDPPLHVLVDLLRALPATANATA